MNGGKGRGEADASASVNKFVKSPIIYKTTPPRKNAGYGPGHSLKALYSDNVK